MSFLPILDRELRVWARGPATHFGRVAVGLIGTLIAVAPLLWASPLSTPARLGHAVFTAITTAGFVLCCAASLVTADSISGERREARLGYCS